MTTRLDTAIYRALFLNDVPMMDVRSPAEFVHGAFPTAHSLPLMNDEERARVGICYKKQGQDAAIKLGLELVAGDLKARRLARWGEFVRQHPQGYLYCFRGGLRSRTVQQWLRESGIDYPLVKGGYKSMRRFLLDELERSLASCELVLIGGKTGSGKTRAITRMASAVDLEGLANHRGSSFGQLPQPQPSQIDFENALSVALLKLLASRQSRVFVEDEGRMIGRLHLPETLRDRMASSPMVVIEQSLAERVAVIVEDYVIDLGQRFAAVYGDRGPALHCKKLLDDLGRIRKRLGGERYQQVSGIIAAAFAAAPPFAAASPNNPDLSLHSQWITVLLEQYYDPMYEYQLSQRGGEVLFRGSRDAVVDWATGVG